MLVKLVAIWLIFLSGNITTVLVFWRTGRIVMVGQPRSFFVQGVFYGVLSAIMGSAILFLT